MVPPNSNNGQISKERARAGRNEELLDKYNVRGEIPPLHNYAGVGPVSLPMAAGVTDYNFAQYIFALCIMYFLVFENKPKD